MYIKLFFKFKRKIVIPQGTNYRFVFICQFDLNKIIVGILD
jgi:hypothetical protein